MKILVICRQSYLEEGGPEGERIDDRIYRNVGFRWRGQGQWSTCRWSGEVGEVSKVYVKDGYGGGRGGINEGGYIDSKENSRISWRLDRLPDFQEYF